MPWLKPLDFSCRASESELMDQADTDTAALFRTLRQFSWINLLFTRSRHLFNRLLMPDIRAHCNRTLTVADIGAGGGDFARWLARACSGMPVRILCIDSDPRVISFCRRSCAAYPSIDVMQADAFDLAQLPLSVDYVVANHFLHHLDNKQIPRLLRVLHATARRGLLINDIRRSPVAYWSYSLFCALAFPRSFAFADGRLSIRKGFRISELADLAAAAHCRPPLNLTSAHPFRLVLWARKPPDK